MDEIQREKRVQHKQRQLDMLHGSLWDKLTLFALPLALTGVLQQLFNTADVAVLGQFVSKEAMAAVGNNTPIISLFVTLFLGLSLGANVVIAQLLGARRPDKASEALHTALPMALVVGVALALIGEITTGPMLAFLSVPENVIGPAEEYLRIYLIGLPIMSLYNFEAAIIRSRGDTRTPLMALAVASAVNIILNLVFTLVFAGGVAGVAIAPVLANVVCAGILYVFLRRDTGVLHLDPKALHIRRAYVSPIVRIGLPAGLQGMVFCISNVIIQYAINGLGADAMAASAAAYTIEINVYCIINSFGQAATTFTSQNFGARNFARCRRILWECIGLNIFYMGLLVIVIYIFATPMLGFFSKDPDVIAMGNTRLFYVTYMQFTNILIEIISGVLRGYGFSLPPAILALVGICGVRLTWIWTIFPGDPTFTNIMVCYPVSWIVTAALLIVLYFWYLKHLRSLLARERKYRQSQA